MVDHHHLKATMCILPICTQHLNLFGEMLEDEKHIPFKSLIPK